MTRSSRIDPPTRGPRRQSLPTSFATSASPPSGGPLSSGPASGGPASGGPPPESTSASTLEPSDPASGCPASGTGTGTQVFIVQVFPGGHGILPEHWRQTFVTHAGPPGRPAQSASTPHSRHVLAPLVTQMGVGSAHCVLSRHPSQLLLMQAGSPGVTQSVSTPHSSQFSPTQIAPPVLPTQCVLFWHSTHSIVVRLQACLLPVALAQSASDEQRSWHVLLVVPMMQWLGGVQ